MDIETLIPAAVLKDFCDRYHIRKLSLFGSVLRSDFSPESDVDILVEFEPGKVPGFAFITIQEELSRLIGRPVDLNTPNSINDRFKPQVLSEAQVLYDAA